MTIATEIADFRIDNWIDTWTVAWSQLPDTVWLRYYNDGRDTLIDRIMKERKDYFYNEIRNWLVNWQREYTFPKRGDLDENNQPMDWLMEIKGISVKFKSTDTNYSKLEESKLENKENDLLSYSTTSDPFYVVSDNSYFLYPTPTETITQGAIIYGIMYPKKLALTDTETLPDQFKKAVLIYIAYRYFKSRWMKDEASLARAEFKEEADRVAISLSGRVTAPKTRTTPNLNRFK